MEKNITVRSLLGTTQSEMAMLLKVSLGQWSMYESGKRKLPAEATVLLGEMIAGIEGTKPNKLPQLAIQETKRKQQLESLLQENEFQLENTSRKIAAIRQKYEGNLKALKLIQFLETKAKREQTPPADTLKIVQDRVVKDLEKNGLTQLTLLESKAQVLKLQHEVLKKRLGRE